MTQTKLSPLAEKLYTKLNADSHLYSIESAAMILMEDSDLSPARRLAYREIWEYSKNDY
jgi:hypothetical protein